MIMNRRKLIYFSIALFFSAALFAQQRVDFIVIEKPSALRIINQYQTSLSEDHPLLKSINAPLQIIECNIALSDQLTYAMKVKFLGRNFYLLLDESGRLSGRANAGKIVEENRCIILNDSIRVLSDKISAQIAPKTTARIPLSANSLYIRLYKKGNRFALMKAGAVPDFYWSGLNPFSEWEKVKNISHTTVVISSQMHEQIIEKFHKANELYRQFFRGFNSHYGQSVTPPHWQVEQNDHSITATLQGMEKSKLQQSCRDLVNQLGYLVLGSRYSISQNDNAIIISQNGGS